MRPLRVISGRQTGVDRAALDAAMECGIPAGGWCPKGRRAEDGFVPHRYPLVETPSRGYTQRTTWNVRDADVTVILILGELAGGSGFTAEVAAKLGKPCLVADLGLYAAADLVTEFLEARRVRTLNVAGPRESRSRGIHDRARQVLLEVFRREEREGRYILR